MTSPAEEVFGPIFLGVLFNLVLYGIMVTQTFVYFSVYRHDRIRTRIFVLVLLVADTANTFFVSSLLYAPLVAEHATEEALVKGSVLWATDPAGTGFITLLVHLFFAWRVKVLTGSKLVVGAIVFGTFAQLFGAIGCAVWVTRVLYYARFQEFKPTVIVWLVCASVVDILITSSLVWHLRRGKTGMSTTDALVDRIIRLTVQTGLITSICAIVDLSVYLASTSTVHLVFNLSLPKLYSNSLLSSLNSRRGWKYDDSDLRPSQPISVPGNGTGSRPQQIFIDVPPQATVGTVVNVDVRGGRYPAAPGVRSSSDFEARNLKVASPIAGLHSDSELRLPAKMDRGESV